MRGRRYLVDGIVGDDNPGGRSGPGEVIRQYAANGWSRVKVVQPIRCTGLTAAYCRITPLPHVNRLIQTRYCEQYCSYTVAPAADVRGPIVKGRVWRRIVFSILGFALISKVCYILVRARPTRNSHQRSMTVPCVARFLACRYQGAKVYVWRGYSSKNLWEASRINTRAIPTTVSGGENQMDRIW